MNASVLREVDLAPERFEVARLDGYDIRVAPRANLVPSSEHCVYGLLAQATHAELSRLYAHAKDVLGQTYLPHPVLVQEASGGWRAALCYIAPTMAPRPCDPEYLERILAPARRFGFPEWYVARLEKEGRRAPPGRS
jgi:hypothetical protein